MKKLLAIFLCLLGVCFLVACNDESIPSQNPSTQDPSEQNSNNTVPKVDVFSDYQDILDTISLLHSQGDAFDTSKYTNLNEREIEIYNSLSHFICGGSGYCIKDINNDGIAELIMLTEAWQLKGLFTLENGLPVLIEKCDNGGIGKDGKIRAEFIEETDEYKKTIFRLNILSGSTLLTEIEFEETAFCNSTKENEYYQVIQREKIKKSHYDLVNLKIDYSFRDYHNLTPSAEITCTRLLDIPVLRERGRYFSLSTLNDPKGVYTYFLEVYDKGGNTVFSCEGDFLSAYQIEVSDQETIVSIYYGDGKKKFYNVLEERFSENFHSENVLTVSGRLIVYVSKGANENRLVVQDIFDESRFYQTYDHESERNGTPSAWFSQDGKSITLKYRLTGDKNDTTRVICLEMLPVLNTKKICYVRYEANISSDCVMASSGVRAVLRADTGDTVRLLSDGTVISGEYESDDGTVRNDWYCIDYRGYICYVTADSFEIDRQNGFE